MLGGTPAGGHFPGSPGCDPAQETVGLLGKLRFT